ncbi:hypothetical protein [Pseudomonas savastanoi]|uniref:hypothetical protein n=2 Tax=Pseudomonas savastanoi TaxID=29438 RepID=UPI000EFF2498|nr:hypothetical protein [Pseudomonas savastanoi]RMU21047.1 hypothetical protein ALP35_200124 [Pseudomonas savastanoi pv. glycinea]
MPIEDIKQLITKTHQGPAQKLLDDGWTLLAVCVKQDGADQYAEYHLGHTEKAETTAMKISPAALWPKPQRRKARVRLYNNGGHVHFPTQASKPQT